VNSPPTERARAAATLQSASATLAIPLGQVPTDHDEPAIEKLTTFKFRAEESPPKGTLYHYPNPHNHQILSVAAQPAPPKIAVQIYTQAIQTKMAVRFMQGEPLEKTLAWAETEVEGFMRT
jgi:hypothetical protein